MKSDHLSRFISRRRLLQGGVITLISGFVLQPKAAWAEHYLDSDEARKAIWGKTAFSAAPVTLTKAQAQSIGKASKTRVRNVKLNAFRSKDGAWFILDQIIGKHEFIDIAVGIDSAGKVKGIEILEYRESYGYEVINPKWRSQFQGKDASTHLVLDKQIKNISGATLSCSHITEGINRLTHTWDQVLRFQ